MHNSSLPEDEFFPGSSFKTLPIKNSPQKRFCNFATILHEAYPDMFKSWSIMKLGYPTAVVLKFAPCIHRKEHWEPKGS